MKKPRPPKEKINSPSEQQIQNAAMMGWEYLGDGYFAKAQIIGYFTTHGFEVD